MLSDRQPRLLEIAGLEVLQIINEPAAALAYDVRSDETEQVLVYDLGWHLVSVVEITGEVTEVLASHGNNQLGGDDFDRRLQLHLAEQFASSTALLSPMIQLPKPDSCELNRLRSP